MGYLSRARLIGMTIFLFLLPLLVSPTGVSHQYPKAIFALTFIPLLLLIWIGERLWKEEPSFTLPPTFWLGLLLLEAALISLVNSNDVKIGLESLGSLMSYMLLYLLIVNTIRGERGLLLLLSAVFAAAVLAAGYGLIQYYGWELFPRPHKISGGTGSMISTIGNKNGLGGFLAYLYPAWAFLLLRARRGWQRALVLVGLGMIWYAIMAVGSRAVWLELGIAAIFLGLGAFRFGIFTFGLLKSGLNWLISLGVAMIAITGLFLFPQPIVGLVRLGLPLLLLALGAISFRAFRALKSAKWVITLTVMAVIAGAFLFPFPELTGKQASIVERIVSGIRALSGPYVRYYDWWVTLEMVKAHPFIGIGLGDFKLEFLDYKARFLETPRGQRYKEIHIAQALQAHNDYLQLWAELGTLGLLVAVAIVCGILNGGWRALGYHSRGGKGKRRGDNERKILWILVTLAGLVGFIVHAFFSFPLHLPSSALALVLILGILDSGYLAAGGQGRRIRLGSHSRWGMVLIILPLALTMIVSAARDFVADLHLRRGELRLERGDIAGAQAELEESIGWDFEPKEALFQLGLVYVRRGEYEKAREIFKRSLKSSPGTITLFNLAVLAYGLGELEEAIDYIDRATQIDPDDLDFLYEKGEIYLAAGRSEEGLRALEEVSAKDKDYYKAYIRLGEYFEDKAEGREKAIEYYKKALRIVKRERLMEEAEELEARLERLRRR